MTSVLEEFHKKTVRLKAAFRVRDGPLYRREVILSAGRRPVEFGASLIHLGALPPQARKMVLAERRPLGAILHLATVGFVSRPRAFFSIKADAKISRALGLSRPRRLYGRSNELRDSRGRRIAEVVEILPPVP